MRRTAPLVTAAENWASVRKVLADFLGALDAALGTAGDPDASDELTPAQEARLEAAVVRHGRRAKQPHPKPQTRRRSAQ